MLYKKSQEKTLDKALFENPTKEYRATPFWAWNCKLDSDLLVKEIGYMKEMGLGGVHIHCRTGLDSDYLGKEYFDFVKLCDEEIKRKDMLCWLYDEDRWPSGAAGGLVTRDHQYRQRYMVFEPEDYIMEGKGKDYMSAGQAVRSEERELIARYDIVLDDYGYMTSYKRLQAGETGDNVWSMYLEVCNDNPWFNNESYVNTMDKKAIDRFIEVTHEKYYEELGEDFGKTIPAIFTDEPQTTHKETMRDPFERKPLILPYTDDFEESFKEMYGVSLLDHIPEIVWETKNKVSQIRYFYHDHVCERFTKAFGDNIGDWCKKHGIELTGHMMSEVSLFSQTMTMGETMRPLKSFGLPGIDMLCDAREYSTAKQAESVAHQFDREGVMSELYGVTSWAFDFRGHKLAGDWQAALGVTVRVPHLTWMSMEGEAKRDYPASIGYQSPWYKEYPYIENHFARVNTAMTRGKADVKVGVIHPVESYWLYWGNQKQTAVVRQAIEANFENTINWLLFGLIDFDFISESILADDNSEITKDGFPMGAMKYDVVIVPGCHTLRKSTVDKLNEYVEKGGKVIFIGKAPYLMDAVESDIPAKLATKCECLPFSSSDIMEALEEYRDIDISVKQLDGLSTRVKHFETGIRANNLFYQMRTDGEDKWVFICHVNPMKNKHIAYTEEWTVTIKGDWQPIVYDTMTGEIYEIEADYVNGNTVLNYYASQHDSLLLKLEKKTSDGKGVRLQAYLPTEKEYVNEPESFVLSEPNVLLMDMAEYALNDGEWQKEEEILRIDNIFRKQLGYPLRMEALAQPWTNKTVEEITNTLHLRFTVDAKVDVKTPMLAVEHPENAVIKVNGAVVSSEAEGYFVDESIKTVKLPDLKAGKNEITLDIPFGSKTNVEWCYLLGDFGVVVNGKEKYITESPKKITFGDYTTQGLPFFAGNLTYEVEINCKAGELYLEVPQYEGALVQISVDGEKKGNLVFAPYRFNCGKVEEGKHKVGITVFGNRSNAFGPVHNADTQEEWHGPNIWRTTGNKWCYEYKLNPMGVLVTPQYWVK